MIFRPRKPPPPEPLPPLPLEPPPPPPVFPDDPPSPWLPPPLRSVTLSLAILSPISYTTRPVARRHTVPLVYRRLWSESPRLGGPGSSKSSPSSTPARASRSVASDGSPPSCRITTSRARAYSSSLSSPRPRIARRSLRLNPSRSGPPGPPIARCRTLRITLVATITAATSSPEMTRIHVVLVHASVRRVSEAVSMCVILTLIE